MIEYKEFLKSKRRVAHPSGIRVGLDEINEAVKNLCSAELSTRQLSLFDEPEPAELEVAL